MVGCESIGSGRLPEAPDRLSPAEAWPSVPAQSQVRPAETTTQPVKRASRPNRPAQRETEFYVTDGSSAIPEAPPKPTGSFDSSFDSIWQSSQGDYVPDPEPTSSPASAPLPVTDDYSRSDSYNSTTTYQASVQPDRTQGREQIPPAPAYTAQPVSRPAPRPAQPAQSRAVQSGQVFALHLASYRNEQNASSGWNQLSRQFEMYLGGLEPRLRIIDIPAKGTFFRLLAGPYSSRAEASSACEELKALGTYCSVMPFSGVNL
ncbi:MAG: SPOR domain-containing protein [Aquisalinus sp.]|nr:SPOR domain-containing protein [Aquisalinus sp.]